MTEGGVVQPMDATPGRTPAEAGRGTVGPDLPGFWEVVIGSVLFLTGGSLLFTVIGIPVGLVMFGAGIGLMLEPKRRTS
jgi:hypothetical protein